MGPKFLLRKSAPEWRSHDRHGSTRVHGMVRRCYRHLYRYPDWLGTKLLAEVVMPDERSIERDARVRELREHAMKQLDTINALTAEIGQAARQVTPTSPATWNAWHGRITRLS